MNDIDIVYTMWANLKKTQGMEVGQVGFHKEKEVRKMKVAKRSNEIVNRLNKTKREEHPGKFSSSNVKFYFVLDIFTFDCIDKNINPADFRLERETRDRLEREDKKKLLREQQEKQKQEQKKRQEDAEMRSYSTLFTKENMTLNTDDGNDSDDFM